MNTTDIFLILGSLCFVNAFFALGEMAIATSSKIKLNQLSEKGNKAATQVLYLLDNPNKFLSIVQLGLNIVAIFVGIFGEANLVPILEKFFYNYFPTYSKDISTFLVIIGTASFFLVFADLIPKRVALLKREQIALFVAPIIIAILKVLNPFVFCLSFVADKILILFGVNLNKENEITAEDLRATLDAGVEAGVLRDKEQYLIKNVFGLQDLTVSSAMTQRKQIIFIDINDDENEMKRKIIGHPHARFLVCDAELDNLLGYIDSSKILKKLLNNQLLTFDREKLKEHGLKPALAVPESIGLFDVMERFKESREDLAVVINEFGLVMGLITINDIMSAVMGEMASNAFEEPLIVLREEGSWLIDGKAPITDLKALFKWTYLPDEEKYQTISGFLMYLMKKNPKKADAIDFQGVKFEIVDTEKYRIDEVMATIIKNQI